MIQNTHIRSLQYVSTLLFIILYGALFTACERPQPKPNEGTKYQGHKVPFVQGTADNVYDISKFKVIDIPSDTDKLDKLLQDGRIITIKTSKGTEEDKVKATASMADVSIDSVSFLNEYYFLDYEVLGTETDNQKLLAKLLGKVPRFKGFPETVYHIVPYLQNNYLILYRVSEREKVPFDEMHTSRQVGNKVATPLVGYPIKYCVAEQILNRNLEETDQFRPKCANVSKNSADYIELLANTKQLFKYESKVNTFPIDFFDGEWFFKKSFVKASKDQGTGEEVKHQNFKNANIVEFEKTANNLKVIDASTYKVRGIDIPYSFSIPGEWKDYAVDHDASTNFIHSFKEIEDDSKKDVDRPYFKINFEKLKESEKRGSSVTDVVSKEITNDYFSFTISKSSNQKNELIKYAFKKKVAEGNNGQKYVAKKWFEKDSTDFFPVFDVTRKYYPKASDRQDTFKRIVRFNPHSSDPSSNAATTTIKWYFSEQTSEDEWVRDFGRKAVEYWNKAFQKAGEGSDYQIKIELDENTNRELGDIRYNILNLMMPEVQGGRSLGFGPNVSDPVTGEILSATANVWIRNIIDKYVVALREYIRFHVYPPAWQLFPDSKLVTDFLHEKIQKKCPEVDQFIQEEKKKDRKWHPNNSPLNDKEIIEGCSKKLAEFRILYLILHEMGHCFGLRHVFSASADAENYYKDYKEIEEIYGSGDFDESTKSHLSPPKFSSVMDYGPADFPQLLVPGKYDIAAIRFVYFDKVEKAGGGLLNVPSGVNEKDEEKSLQKSISDVVKSIGNNVGVKKYKVCQSEDEVNSDDLLCSKYDYGSTPLEVVENYIRKGQGSLMRNRRYDSVGQFAMRSYVSYHFQAARVANSLSIFYKKWIDLRDELLSGSSQGEISSYAFFDDDSMVEYNSLIEKKAEADGSSHFKAYYDIRQPVFDYYKKILFLPPKHCIYQQSDGTYQAVALETIIERIENQFPDDDREIVVDCQSPVIRKWATDKSIGKFITEVGYFVNNREYFIKPVKEDQWDEYSPFSVPRVSVDEKGRPVPVVGPSPYGHIVDNFAGLAGVIFQDPGFLKEILEELKEYIIGDGRDFNPYINRGDVILPRFLSYNIDSKVPVTYLRTTTTSFEVFIMDIMKIAIKMMMRNSNFTTQKHKDFVTRTMEEWDFDSVSELGAYLRDTDLNSKLETIPFIFDLYQEYQDDGKSLTEQQLLSALLDHSSVCRGQNKVRVPHYKKDKDKDEENFSGQVCQKFNKYHKCINDEADCENKEDKVVFLRKYAIE